MFNRKHKTIQKIYNVLQQNKFTGSTILSTYQTSFLIKTTIKLNESRTRDDLLELLPNLQQELNAHDYRITQSIGKQFTIEFGTRNIDKVSYNDTLLMNGSLMINLPSSYDNHLLDFADGSSCHCLIAGATRMGKTRALLYMITQLTRQTNNNIKIYINSPKPKDFYPFNNVHTLANTNEEIKKVLHGLIHEYKKRNDLLNEPSRIKATDASDILKYYPHDYHLFNPIFLVIDEYARFSDDKEIQSLVVELSETAGFVNIHLIISTQRPDAKQVLNPRLKANLLTRIAFTTTTEGNSMLILDREGAEQLGGKRGRAIILDGESSIIQFPNLDHEKAYELMKPFERKDNHEQEAKRRNDNNLSDKIQSMYTQPDSTSNIQ